MEIKLLAFCSPVVVITEILLVMHVSISVLLGSYLMSLPLKNLH